MMNAVDYNAAQVGKLWQVCQLPEPLRTAWSLGAVPFAGKVAELQRLLGLPADGKLGPTTLARIGREPVDLVVLPGFDVSGWQPIEKFDEAKLRASGMAWAAVKVSQEGKQSNKYAQAHIDLFIKCGLAVMPYHFADVSEDPKKQADLLCERGVRLFAGRPSLPPMIDLEWFEDHNKLPDSKFREWLPVHVERIRDNTGRNPVLYTGPNFWREHLDKPLTNLGRVELFVVDYSHPEAPPTLPPGFTSWTFRQYTNKGRPAWYDDGKTNIDLGTFNGDLAALKRLVQ